MKGDELVVGKLQKMSQGFMQVDNSVATTTTQTSKLNKKTGEYVGTVTQKSVPATKKFAFEYLGLMFAGMAVQRMFTGLLQPALQVSGVFEVIANILELLFLPVALLLLDPLLGILEFVANLPDEAKAFIGVIVLIGAIIGGLVFLLAQVVLAFGALSLAWPGIVAAAGLVSGVFGSIVTVVGGSLLPIIVAAIAILALLLIAFDNNSEGIMDAVNSFFSVVSEVFADLMLIFEGVLEFLDGVFTGDVDKAMSGVGKIFQGAVDLIIDLFIGLPLTFANIFLQIGIGIGKWLLKMPEFILGFASRITSAFVRLFVGAIEAGIRGVGKIVSDPLGAFGGLLSNIIPGFANGGIVTRPTLAMVGEAGPEAIVPLGGGGGGISSGDTFISEFHISANIENDMDIRELAERINDEMIDDKNRRKVI